MSESPVQLRIDLPISREELDARINAALVVAAEKVTRELLADEQVISLEAAAGMTPWTMSGFKRVAGRENLAEVKGPHKSPPGYRRGDVVAMLQRMRVWPNGKPVALHPLSAVA